MNNAAISATTGRGFVVCNFAALVIGLFPATCALAADWPALPEKDGTAMIPAQPAEGTTAAREAKVYIHYPRGELRHVGERTGLMLTLHNWGGTGAVGTARPQTLAERYDVVAIAVDYLHSGPWNEAAPELAYDFGYVQALDALRALWLVHHGLQEQKRPFAAGRIYATGGSGGGNVALMVSKLAPRTLACVIDLCGMAKLTDDVAYGLPGGSSLNAGYQREGTGPRRLTADMQALRFVGQPDHLREMRRLGAAAKVIVVHGADDDVCPAAEKRELVENMRAAEFAVEPHFITAADLDGKVLTGSGHSLGDRSGIVIRFADDYLLPDGKQALVRHGPSDFDRRESIEYRTPGGKYVISYEQGYPVGRFEP